MDKPPVYLDDKSILVSTRKGLRRLQVPFIVVVVIAADSLEIGDKVQVMLVSFSQTDPLLYYIRNRYYNYSLFLIEGVR